MQLIRPSSPHHLPQSLKVDRQWFPFEGGSAVHSVFCFSGSAWRPLSAFCSFLSLSLFRVAFLDSIFGSELSFFVSCCGLLFSGAVLPLFLLCFGFSL